MSPCRYLKGSAASMCGGTGLVFGGRCERCMKHTPSVTVGRHLPVRLWIHRERADSVFRVRFSNANRQQSRSVDVMDKCPCFQERLATDWWGEGDDMIFIDGDAKPTLNGTGLEDYFCGAWNFNLLNREYNFPYFGYSRKGNADYTGRHSMYRFHIEDPIIFDRSLRVTIEHGHANDRSDDYSSVAYWYQTEPHKRFPPLPPVAERLPIDRWNVVPIR
jgi:hypothetical protein